MPIEIKELHIRVSVNVPQGGQMAESKATTAGFANLKRDGEIDAIVAECVEQVLDILRNKRDR
ncbi:MAG: hypothetical protein H6937_08270 [Burkholderiales bacterium]|jgi:hypothetical protein|nr:hypothetical protein [Burkholderiales bacterium]MCP5252638.1 hypothetical protein [Burkholderiales bacterium]